MKAEPAIVLTSGLLAGISAKTCHGLLRGSDRFRVAAVIDEQHAGRDAGEVMDGKPIGVPVYGSFEALLAAEPDPPRILVVGVAFPGGRLPVSARGSIAGALRQGFRIVSGLHELLSDDAEFRRLAQEHGGEILDIRRPRPAQDLTFWDGSIYQVRAARVAVLGTDCAIGKRTTCRFLFEACRGAGLATEMIYTGQTGWMQGYPYGFIFDSTLNDFVSGELEKAVVDCDRELAPDLILLEGQSALRNPSGPCGSELLLSAAAHGVILQHAPGRDLFHHQEHLGNRLPTAQQEIDLIQAYGVPVLAVTLHEEGLDDEALDETKEDLAIELGIPVLRPLKEGVGQLVPLMRALISRTRSKAPQG